MSPAGEPEWDTYFRTLPTYNTQREFWDSRHESFTGDSEISGNLFSPLVESHQPDFQQIELVDTVTSDLDSESDLVTCVSKRADMSTSDSTEAHARQRETYLREFEVKLKHNTERFLFKISDFTEDDLASENVKQVEVMLKEIRDEHVGIAVNIQGVIEEYRIELGVTEVEQWEEAIADQSRKVKAHAKKIRAKAEQITPTRAISAFESEMLQAQKATAEAQIKLVELELKKQDRERKESRALVSSKALEFKDKVKVLEDHIKLVETREDPDFWKDTGAETITRAMKDLKLWNTTLAAIEDVFREFERLVKIHGEPDNAAQTGYDLNSIEDLLTDLRIDFKDAKESVTKEDKDRALFSLEQNKGEILKYPTFAGEAGQDLVKFKEKMLYRFKRNQVAK